MRSSDRLQKHRQLLRAMTLVIARADRLGYAQVIATMDALKTAVVRAATTAGRHQQRLTRGGRRLKQTG